MSRVKNRKLRGIKRIIDGKMACNTDDLKTYYYDWAIKEKEELEAVLSECYEKFENPLNRSDMLIKFIDIFEHQLNIINQYFELLEYRKINSDKEEMRKNV